VLIVASGVIPAVGLLFIHGGPGADSESVSMTVAMALVVGCDGGVMCINHAGKDLREHGKRQITRASHAEPDAGGYWWADMRPSGGPVMGPYCSRSEALGAERSCLLSQNSSKPE
jgi:hypothetical protein